MGNPFKKIESGDKKVWITQPKEIEKILKRKEIALKIAKGKMIDNGGKIETAMQTAEAFGRGLFEELLKDESIEWTMDKWLEPVIKNIFNPMGTGATFTNISNDKAKSYIFSYGQSNEETDDRIATLFNYGFLRGIFRSAFPNGELILENSMVDGAQMDEFIFKANAVESDRLEREKIKNDYISKKILS